MSNSDAERSRRRVALITSPPKTTALADYDGEAWGFKSPPAKVNNEWDKRKGRGKGKPSNVYNRWGE